MKHIWTLHVQEKSHTVKKILNTLNSQHQRGAQQKSHILKYHSPMTFRPVSKSPEVSLLMSLIKSWSAICPHWKQPHDAALSLQLPTKLHLKSQTKVYMKDGNFQLQRHMVSLPRQAPSHESKQKGLQPVCLTSNDTGMPNMVSYTAVVKKLQTSQ